MASGDDSTAETVDPSAAVARGRIFLAGGMIVAAGLAAYWNSLGCPFVFDDMPAIVNDGVNTDRCIDTVTSPAFAICAPALGATRGATSPTASARPAATVRRRFVEREARIISRISPATERTE